MPCAANLLSSLLNPSSSTLARTSPLWSCCFLKPSQVGCVDGSERASNLRLLHCFSLLDQRHGFGPAPHLGGPVLPCPCVDGPGSCSFCLVILGSLPFLVRYMVNSASLRTSLSAGDNGSFMLMVSGGGASLLEGFLVVTCSCAHHLVWPVITCPCEDGPSSGVFAAVIS